MKIRVIREYSGEEGSGPDKNVDAGTEHDVPRQRGLALVANGLAEILDEREHPDDAEKEQATPENKAAPEPEKKPAPKTAKKKA